VLEEPVEWPSSSWYSGATIWTTGWLLAASRRKIKNY